MYVARILYPVKVLGPGNRIGLWLSGCHRGCPGCSNPELWEQREEQRISVQRLSEILHRLAEEHTVDGITITGGEPFEQTGEMHGLLTLIGDITADVLIYTGFALEELEARGDPETAAALGWTAVLIDGAYRQELNGALPLRGSQNQRIHCFRPELWQAYAECLGGSGQAIQNFTIGSSVVSVGIHRAGFAAELPEFTAQKGLTTDE